jgi:cation diffusion facilitator CzcD-associated flavoprotein CzcO
VSDGAAAPPASTDGAFQFVSRGLVRVRLTEPPYGPVPPSFIRPAMSSPSDRPEAESRVAVVDLGQVDVLLVGAGISGIGGACHLRTQQPGRRFLILDDQDGFGGTWWTHRYPGVRSDSDLYTFGYRFKPWLGAPIATGDEILAYLGEVIDEYDLAPHIHYRHRVLSASWSTQAARWRVEGVRTDTGERFRVTAGFLWMGAGYYRHDRGHLPQWPGMARFSGRVIHPQRWPADLALDGKRVLLIGSGATAATLIPAIAERCAQVTMLQRSPTYFRIGRNTLELADLLRSLEIPDAWTHEIVRRKILRDSREIVRMAFENPEALRKELLAGVLAHVGSEAVVREHFTPRYLPWRQRIAFIPDGDFFAAIRSGRVAVVTDEIEAFVDDGVQVKSGATIGADVVISATGLELQALGGIALEVDGVPVDPAQCLTWRGTMFTGLPNLMWVFGYFRASWTLRVDLLGDLMCRLLARMDQTGATQVMPQRRPEDATMPVLPWVESSDFNPSYLTRALDRLPKQGDRQPWRHTQDYWADAVELPAADLDDGSLVFGPAPTGADEAQR